MRGRLKQGFKKRSKQFAAVFLTANMTLTAFWPDVSYAADIPMSINTKFSFDSNETGLTDPIINYNFGETLAGTIIKDTSGNDWDGTLYGNAAYVTDRETNSQVLYLDGTDNTYAAFPDNFFTGRNTFTLSMDIKSQTTATHFFTWTVGKNNNAYMFLRTRDKQIRNAITTGSYSSEEAAGATVNSILNRWINVKVVVTDTAMAIYEDGVLICENNNIGTSISDLGENLLSYLGKSFYSADAYFTGYFDNIQIYDRALTELEIAESEGVEIAALKGVDADGYRIITSKADSENKILDLYFSKSNSMNTELSAVPLSLDMVEGTVLVTDITNGVDLTGDGAEVEVQLSGQAKSENWKIKGTWCNNPVLAGEYADPDIDVFGDTYYIYPTTDGYTGWIGTQFHVFSSKDLVNWEDQGIILDVSSDVAWSVGSAWAPAVEEKNGKYYFYFCAKNSSGASCIGVATADSPTGPFTPEGEPLLTKTICSNINMGQTIDPYVFTDEDGASYLLFGNGYPAVVELNDDMISIKEETMQNLSGLTNFRESVTVIKRNGTYHFTWSCDDTGSADYHVKYGIADSIFGPVTYQYSVLEKDTENDILGTGHQSFIQIPDKDEYYIAYHRFYTPLGFYNSGLGYHRETCIDKVTFDDTTGLMNVITPTLEGAAGEKLEETGGSTPEKTEYARLLAYIARGDTERTDCPTMLIH
jgi:GH43 family beta-xylosidase